jgi:hypothetical protein
MNDKSKEILRYGVPFTDDSIVDKDGNEIRIRVIWYPKENIRYYHKMVNGEVVKIVDIG